MCTSKFKVGDLFFYCNTNCLCVITDYFNKCYTYEVLICDNKRHYCDTSSFNMFHNESFFCNKIKKFNYNPKLAKLLYL